MPKQPKPGLDRVKLTLNDASETKVVGQAKASDPSDRSDAADPSEAQEAVK